MSCSLQPSYLKPPFQLCIIITYSSPTERLVSPCSSLNIVVCCETALATEMCSHQVTLELLDVLLTLNGDTPSCCARLATKPSVMAVLCTNVNKDIKNNSNAHLHVGALMNPHLYSHTLISNSDKAPPPNTHRRSAQPFSRDWLPSPQWDRHVPTKHACICKRGCLSVVYSVFVNKIPEAIVAFRWLALVDTTKEVLFRCISFTR